MKLKVRSTIALAKNHRKIVQNTSLNEQHTLSPVALLMNTKYTHPHINVDISKALLSFSKHDED